MRDTVAEVVADRFVELVETLQAMGLREESILAGMELASRRVRDASPREDGG